MTILTDQEKIDIRTISPIRTPAEIQKMKTAGNIAAQILNILGEHVKPGITSRELDKMAHDLIINDFKAEVDRTDLEGHQSHSSQCIYFSRNEIAARGEVDDVPLKQGDIFGIDLSLKKDGWCGDTQKMWIVGGDTSPLAMRLMAVAHQAMWVGVKMVRPGVQLGTISHSVEKYIVDQGFKSIVQFGLTAHSIGQKHFEGLRIPFFGEQPNTGHKLQKGMVITIEPFATSGDGQVDIIKNTMLTAVTRDKSLSAMWEHVVAVTDNGYEVLDLRPGERES